MAPVDFINVGNPIVRDFYPSDTEELFQKNLKTQPADWKYRNYPIQYNLNSMGYRCPAFDQIDWGKCIVIFGCSMVMGVGLHENDTISSQLCRMTGRPVVNMGIGGSSMELSLYNSGILRWNRPRPWAVVHVWTAYDRCTEFNGNTQNNHSAHGDRSWPSMYYLMINQSATNQQVRARYQQVMARSLWLETGTKYFDCSFFPDTAKLLDCPSIDIIDRARDVVPVAYPPYLGGHPGIQTVELTAQTIARGLDI
jgi:hypothetical protein